MENSSPPVKKSAFGLVAAAAISGAAVCVFPFALLAAPALWTAVMFRTRPWALLPLAAATAAFFFLVYPPVAAAAIALLTALPALIFYVMQSRRAGNSYTLAVAAAACILVLYAAVCLPGILNGSGAFAGAQAFVDRALAASRETAAAMLSGASSGDVLASYDAYIQSISEAVPASTVSVLCFAGILIALANFLLFRLFVRRIKPAITPLRAFRFWAVPQTFSAGIFVFLLGSLALELFGADYAPGVSSTVNVLVGIPLMLQGLSVVDFLIVRRGGRVQTRRALFYVAIGLLLPLLQTALMLLGCMEQLLRYRDRAGLIPPTTPRNP